MVTLFIDLHREELGIEPICRELAIGPVLQSSMLPGSLIPPGVRAVLAGTTR